MAKTYNTFTDVATGDVLTATNFNNVLENVNNYRVPPMVQVRRTSNLTSYAADAAITWQSALYDTESPSDPMWAASPNATRVTVKTAGIYAVTFTGRATGSATITLGNARIKLNGSFVSDHFIPPFGGTAIQFSVTDVLNLAATDFIEAAVGLVGGSAYVVEGNASYSAAQTRLSLSWLGQAS